MELRRLFPSPFRALCLHRPRFYDHTTKPLQLKVSKLTRGVSGVSGAQWQRQKKEALGCQNQGPQFLNRTLFFGATIRPAIEAWIVVL
jgi:hypothetical protein